MDRCLTVCLCCSVCKTITLVHCGQTVGRIKMKLSTQVGLCPGHIVLDGDPTPPRRKGTAPQFSAHICCGQMARWIKMPLGRKVGIDQSDIVLDADSAPLRKGGGAEPPICMNQDATWYGGRRRPKRHNYCGRWGPSSASPKRGRIPQFSSHVYCGQTAAWIKMLLGKE